jgi:hypothetical protein
MNLPLRYALIASALVIVWKLSLYVAHAQLTLAGQFAGLISLALVFIPLFLGIRQKRNKELGGYISLRQVMLTGMAISVISSVIIAVFTYIYYEYIDKEIVQMYLSHAEKEMTAQKKPAGEIQQQFAAITAFFNPLRQASIALLNLMVAGVILSFISSTFLLKKLPRQVN